jgi:uncharacterized protein involved in exopolysaccharide biosynthesis
MSATETHHITENGTPAGSAVPTVADHLARALEIIRRNATILAVMTLGAGIVAGAIASLGSGHYDATAKLLLSDTPIVRSTELERATPPGDPEREVNTQISLIRIGTVADAVRARLHLQTSRDALTRKVRTAAEGTTNIVDVTAEDANATLAASIANGFAREYVAFRDTIAQSALREAANRVRSELAGLTAADRSGGRGKALTSRLHELEIASASETGGAEVVLRATPPRTASGPRPLKSALIGAFLGLLVALGIVACIELLPMGRRGPQQFAALQGVRGHETAPLLRPRD